MQQACIRDATIRMNAPVRLDLLLPSRFAAGESGRVEQRRAGELVLVEVGYDLVALFDESDRTTERSLRADMADDQAY